MCVQRKPDINFNGTERRKHESQFDIRDDCGVACELFGFSLNVI